MAILGKNPNETAYAGGKKHWADLTLPTAESRGILGCIRQSISGSLKPQARGCAITPPEPVHIATQADCLLPATTGSFIVLPLTTHTVLPNR